MKCALLLWMLSVIRGGTERVGAELANALAERGHELIIFTRDHGDGRPVYPLHPAIKLEFLGEKSLHHPKMNQKQWHLCVQDWITTG